MKTFSVPPLHVVGASEIALDGLLHQVATAPQQVGFRAYDGHSWVGVSYREFLARARRLALGLIDAGVQPGERVALMSRTRLEWSLCDYAVWLAAAVTVPIYETSSAEQVAWMLSDSAAAAVIVETAQHAELISGLTSPPCLRLVWQMDTGDLDMLETRGRGVDEGELATRQACLGAASLATIVYTSGTTGQPKGCALTHGNLVATYSNTVDAPGIPDIFNNTSSTLLFLPLAHCLARIIGLSCVNAGVCIAYAPNVKDLPSHLASFRPTLLLSVPRVFEKLYNTARHTAQQQRKGPVFDRAEQVAISYSKALEQGRPALVLRLEHQLFDRLVYRRLRAAMGGNIRWSVSGGAPLGVRLGHFFRGAGVTVLEGYGLSETATGGTLNLPGQQQVGSVGRPIPGCEIGIDTDGEVLIRAAFVMSGYWQNEVATKEAIDDDGWLHTGDIGEFDEQGFLSITGRKKELLVTSGGKNVAPTVLEDRLRANELVSQCIVVGDARPYIACLLTIDPLELPRWKAEHGKAAGLPFTELRADPELRAALQHAVDNANAAVSKAESIRRWQVLDGDFTEAGGELTPTLKLKRTVITERYRSDVEALYS